MLASPYGLAGREPLAAAVSATLKKGTLSEAKGLVRTYRQLTRLTEETESIFGVSATSYLKPGERRFMKLFPWSRRMFEGTARDRILKGLVEREQALSQLGGLKIVGQGAKGADFFRGRIGFDLTTSSSWGRHLSRYVGGPIRRGEKPLYDILLPLFYR
jgi:hypothetical protein